MARLLLLIALALAAGGEDWPSVWRALARLEALPADAPEREAERARLAEIAARRPDDAPEDRLRRRVLADQLARLDGSGGGSVVPLPGERVEPAPGEALLFARALVQGPERDRCILAALAEARDPRQRYEAQLVGHRALVAYADRADLEPALPIARALHESARAPWSADSYALVLTRLGRYAEAREVLDGAIEEAPPGSERVQLVERRGLVALGAGELRAARRDLAAALAGGLGDAAAVLALLDLEAGRTERARRLFRAARALDPAQSWAPRGWALSMVP